jgi:hypothetical protein
VVDQNNELPVVQKLLDRIVASTQRLVALDSSGTGELLAQLRVLAMRGGTSIYVWEPENGLASLREGGVGVPGSKRLTDALRFVLQSMHFGIYLFTGFEPHLKAADTLLLRRISRSPAPNERKLVFIGSGFELPEELEGMFERLTAESEMHRKLRLRDGRWVT